MPGKPGAASSSKGDEPPRQPKKPAAPKPPTASSSKNETPPAQSKKPGASKAAAASSSKANTPSNQPKQSAGTKSAAVSSSEDDASWKQPKKPAGLKPAAASSKVHTQSEQPKKSPAPKPKLSYKNNSFVDNDLDEPDLSFGVELEYIFVSSKDRSDDDAWPSLNPDQQGVEVVREAISGSLKAQCRLCQQPVRFKLPLNCNPDPFLEDDDDYALWDVIEERLDSVAEEREALGSEKENYVCTGVEIRSRILSPIMDLEVFDSVSTTCSLHKISPEQEISAVLRALKQRFCTFPDGRKSDFLYPNPQCGLHVHVGNQGEKFELQEVKNVMSMYVACERLIDEVQAPHRTSWTDMAMRPMSRFKPTDDIEHSSVYMRDPEVCNVPLSAPFILAVCGRRQRQFRGRTEIPVIPMPWKEHRGGYPETHKNDEMINRNRWACDIDAWLYLIQAAPTMVDLCALYGVRSKSTVLSILNISHPRTAYSIKHTIEFRGAASTLQAEPMLAWVDFAVKLVSYCQQNGWFALSNHIGNQGTLRQPNANFAMLAQQIGCKEDTLKYYKERLEQPTGECVRNLRGAEKLQALSGKKNGDPLADLALYSIEQERRDMDSRNARARVSMKLREGGYGQFPLPVANGIAQALGFQLTESEQKRNKMGYQPPFVIDDDDDVQMPIPEAVHQPPPSDGDPDEDLESLVSSIASLSSEGSSARSQRRAASVGPSPSAPILAGKVRSTLSASRTSSNDNRGRPRDNTEASADTSRSTSRRGPRQTSDSPGVPSPESQDRGRAASGEAPESWEDERSPSTGNTPARAISVSSSVSRPSSSGESAARRN